MEDIAGFINDEAESLVQAVNGEGSKLAAAQLVRHNFGNRSTPVGEVPKIVICGTMFGMFGKTNELWSGGFLFKTLQRRTGDYFSSCHLRSIVGVLDYEDDKYWPRELPTHNSSGIGKAYIRYIETRRIQEKDTTKRLLSEERDVNYSGLKPRAFRAGCLA